MELQSFPSNISDTEQGSTSVNTDLQPLYKAVCGGDLDAVNKFFIGHPEAVRAWITPSGDTALHLAVMFKHFHIIKMLLELMSPEDLEVTDLSGSTPLHHATPDRNNIKIAKCLVERNKKLLTISNDRRIPVTLALDFGNIEMTRYLYSVTPSEVLLPENGIQGAMLLTRCYYSKMLDVALDLLKLCPRLVVTPRLGKGKNFLEALASAPMAILNESQLSYWQQWIYKWVHVHQEPTSSINEILVSILETNTKEDDNTSTSPGLLHELVSNALNLLGFKNMYEAKLAHKQSLELLRAVCNVISTLEDPRTMNDVHSAVSLAAQRGNAEFIVEAVKAHLFLVWTINADKKHIFHLAIEFRQAKVFSLIHGFIQKERFSSILDENENNMLHMAGMLAPSTYLSQISGAALQMQRELQWFKEVESIMPPMRRDSLNKQQKTPREFFTENHSVLVKQGEEWMKDTARSCSVVAALVVTITFAAAFTVPGGNDQVKGYPILLYKKLFMLFIISDAVSLFSSSTSLLMFLGLLTSRYAEDDFLKSLPTKLVIGLSTMFISLATMMTAFCAALFLLLHDKTWIVIPVTLLACVPVTLYILLQFQLLVEIYKSTFGASIFDRNVKRWPVLD